MRFGGRRRPQSPDLRHLPAPEGGAPGSEEQPSATSTHDEARFRTIEPLPVRPAGVEPEQPWPLGANFPPALAMDFGDAADGLVAIRAASLRGNSHLELSQPRQDSYAVLVDKGFMHLAVADGVGTQEHSHLGSEVAVRTALEASRLGAEPPQIADAVVRALQVHASSVGLDPVRLSTTLCWARVTLGAPSKPWRVEVAEWGDSELLVYDTRELRAGHPKWQRLRKSDNCTANSVLALPVHQVIQAQSSTSLWHPGEVLGLYSDGIASDIRHDTVLGHALAKAWHAVPSPWEYVGHLAFRYRPANDDRTAITLWRRDEAPEILAGISNNRQESGQGPAESTTSEGVPKEPQNAYHPHSQASPGPGEAE